MISLMIGPKTRGVTMLIGGFLLSGLLSGCGHPLVETVVTVDTCQSGPRPPLVEPPPGGYCTQGSPITSPISATGAYIANTTPADLITADEGRMCTSGSRFGGSSCNFIPCIWKYTPDASDPKKGTCTTACKWAGF